MVSEAVKPLTVPKEFLGPPKGFNPTLLVFILAIGGLVLSTTGYLYWHLPAWCSFIFNTIALHVLGTVVHDACHDSAHSDRFMNGFMGQVSAFLICTTFPVFTRVHMQHHAHVNHPDDDPDHYVSHGGPLLLIAPRFFYHEVFFLKRRLWIKNEFYEWLVARLLLVAIVAFAIYRDGVQEGAFSFIMTFWFLPAMVVGSVLGLFFDYLPHRPFQERDRWKNARVYPNQLLNWLIMGQNYHLVHHLWPSIPWYQYQPAYYAVKPLLDDKGCHQTIGLWDRENFWPFVYDIFIGLHKH
ncbi:MAG: fatty acid desaturase [Leptolyngbyaceae cyanobacterium bins.59]|nr:fatty acid desaturase [Leptolyngbyaceae cyanobacterium bins.59]